MGWIPQALASALQQAAELNVKLIITIIHLSL